MLNSYSGIGYAIALRELVKTYPASIRIAQALDVGLAQDGVAIGVNDVHQKLEAINELVAKIKSAGGKAVAVPADVSKEIEVTEMVETVVDGANAGVKAPGESLLQMKEETFDAVMAVNCKGTLYCYRAAAKQMIKQGSEWGGRIVGANSAFGLRGMSGTSDIFT
ncbi:hypothetical protein FRC10_008758 [Ceratobasidium sp. 414]|nr:hypothetical protein FRC10_008758 [Ceratobasidium sp. 414]